ncbi:MAG: hypothetical protein GXO85_11125 [Chlorobi bacterium]|nr:hypothetical protein [Chlorobiota bacterium]
MTFCTAISCMDGRIQLPVIRYLQKRFNSEYVDMITEAGINKVLAEEINTSQIHSIINRVKISVDIHKSKSIAIIGHHDCARNPIPKKEQVIQIKKAMDFLKQNYNNCEIIGLWVDENWEVNEI